MSKRDTRLIKLASDLLDESFDLSFEASAASWLRPIRKARLMAFSWAYHDAAERLFYALNPNADSVVKVEHGNGYTVVTKSDVRPWE